jgi:hypothetical protein
MSSRKHPTRRLLCQKLLFIGLNCWAITPQHFFHLIHLDPLTLHNMQVLQSRNNLILHLETHCESIFNALLNRLYRVLLLNVVNHCIGCRLVDCFFAGKIDHHVWATGDDHADGVNYYLSWIIRNTGGGWI